MTCRLSSSIALLALGCVASGVDATQQPIVHGEPAELEDLYATVHVQWRSNDGSGYGGSCSGTLIAPRIVLTAAHCVAALDDSLRVAREAVADELTVHAGALDPDAATVAQTYRVVGVVAHPEWPNWDWTLPTGLGRYDDVALLELDRDVSQLQPIAMLPAERVERDLDVGGTLRIVGFGLHDEPHLPELRAHLGEVEIVDRSETELLTDDSYSDPCTGDSGGPAYLVSGSAVYLAGVVSRARLDGGDECGTGSIFSIVPAYADWIEDEVDVGIAATSDGCSAAGGHGGVVALFGMLLLGRRASWR